MGVELTVVVIRSLTGCVAGSRRNRDSIKRHRCSLKIHRISNLFVRSRIVIFRPEQIACSFTLIVGDVPILKTVVCNSRHLVQIGRTIHKLHLYFIMVSAFTDTVPLAARSPVQHTIIPVNDFAGCLVTARINGSYLHPVA